MEAPTWLDSLGERFPRALPAQVRQDWQSLKERYEVGRPVEGVVVAKAPFGAWIDLGIGFPALLEADLVANLTPDLYRAGAWCPVGSQVAASIRALVDSRQEVHLQQVDPWGNSPDPKLQVLPASLFKQHCRVLLHHFSRHLPSELHHVLEFGCGSRHYAARLFYELHARCGHYVQMDSNPEFVGEARRRNPVADVRLGDIRDASEIGDETQDIVLALSVLDHILDNADRVAAEVTRILKPGGVFLYIHDQIFSIPRILSGFSAQQGSAVLLPGPFAQATNDHDFVYAPADQLHRSVAKAREYFAQNPDDNASLHMNRLSDYLEDPPRILDAYRKSSPADGSLAAIASIRQAVYWLYAFCGLRLIPLSNATVASAHFETFFQRHLKASEAGLFTLRGVCTRSEVPLAQDFPESHAWLVRNFGVHGFSCSAEPKALLGTPIPCFRMQTPGTIGEIVWREAASTEETELSFVTTLYGFCARKA
ncbi:MAG: methyltransferase domain-containing protein [Pirellulales bacterium]